MPRSVLLLARVHLAVMGLAVLAGLVGGLAMQLELWSPGGGPGSAYGNMLALHGLSVVAIGAPALAGSAGYVTVAELVEVRALRARGVPWIAFALWMIGLVALALALVVPRGENDWTMYSPDGAALTAQVSLHWIASHALPAAGLIHAAYLGGAIAMHARGRSVARLAIAALFVLAVGAASFVPGASVVAGIVLAAAALLCERRRAAPVVLVGCAPALATMMLRPLADVPDLPLHDTYVEVAAIHQGAAVIVFAVVATVAAWSVRVPQVILLWVGTSIASAGLLLHLYASVALGTAGMPRRYWDYDQIFRAHHQLAGIGAAIAVAGSIVLALAWFVPRKGQSVSIHTM